MSLWGGRFHSETSEIMKKFNTSLSYDKRLYLEDIRGSIAHVKMLQFVEILTSEETKKIEDGLIGILKDIQTDKLKIEGDFEDIHSFIELELTARIGEVGKKLHTARSRNDQVAVDMKLYTKKMSTYVIKLIDKLIKTVDGVAKRNPYIMPGYTHLQKAQVTTFSYHLKAYIEMFTRDKKRIENAVDLLNESPLGASALAGTTHTIDREFTSIALGFNKPTNNFLDSVSDRDYLIELMSAFSILMMHLSRLSEEIIIWSTTEFNFIKLSDSFSTGSSIMPQKKNPDGAELIRGKTGRVYGDLITLLVTMKGLPLAYNKDMQEDKEAFFDSLDTTIDCIKIMTGMIDSIEVNKDVLEEACKTGYLNATALADYLVKNDVSFRDAHEIVGKIVALSEKKNQAIESLSLSDMQKISSVIKEDVYEYLQYESILKQGNKKEMTNE